MNFLPGELAEGGKAARLETGLLLPFADGPRPGADGRPLILGIRPEHLELGSGGLSVSVDLVEPMGSESLVHGHVAGDGSLPLIVRLTSGTAIGETLPVRIPPARVHVFDRATGRRIAPETEETGRVRLEAGTTGV
jgi:sn-glycerol 3-phosphate transport system ATP-binding protein